MRDGLPVLADGRVMEVANVIWCTGFRPGLRLDRPAGLRPGRRPAHDRGVVASQPGLYFLGPWFLSLDLVAARRGRQGRRHIAEQIASRRSDGRTPTGVPIAARLAVNRD